MGLRWVEWKEMTHRQLSPPYMLFLNLRSLPDCFSGMWAPYENWRLLKPIRLSPVSDLSTSRYWIYRNVRNNPLNISHAAIIDTMPSPLIFCNAWCWLTYCNYINTDFCFVLDHLRHFIGSMRQNIGLFEELDEMLDLLDWPISIIS